MHWTQCNGHWAWGPCEPDVRLRESVLRLIETEVLWISLNCGQCGVDQVPVLLCAALSLSLTLPVTVTVWLTRLYEGNIQAATPPFLFNLTIHH